MVASASNRSQDTSLETFLASFGQREGGAWQLFCVLRLSVHDKITCSADHAFQQTTVCILRTRNWALEPWTCARSPTSDLLLCLRYCQGVPRGSC
jgi:hypothetical protein